MYWLVTVQSHNITLPFSSSPPPLTTTPLASLAPSCLCKHTRGKKCRVPSTSAVPGHLGALSLWQGNPLPPFQENHVLSNFHGRKIPRSVASAVSRPSHELYITLSCSYTWWWHEPAGWLTINGNHTFCVPHAFMYASMPSLDCESDFKKPHIRAKPYLHAADGLIWVFPTHLPNPSHCRVVNNSGGVWHN